MAGINRNYCNLQSGYLFPEIGRRTRKFQEENPGIEVIKLGIGDTTEPLPSTVIKGLNFGVQKLSSKETYTGYGDGQGNSELRKLLSNYYIDKDCDISIDEIFISDGAKPDSGNIQSIFSKDNIVAVQDPAYPVYVDTNVIAGRATGYNENTGQYDGILYMPCTEENDFFPEIPESKVDIIYLCSPNNPTGAVATKGQLRDFIDYARENKAVIIFDAAYSAFISNKELPRTIYEVDGATECAIEINSFSKMAGFTGVRLGWSVVPKKLVCEDGGGGKLHSLWKRRQCTFFNGASNIVQQGGIAVLTDGQQECQMVIDYYKKNVNIIFEGLKDIGFTVFGGTNAPYVWVKTPGGMSSWDFFDKLLNEANVVVTPGSGFGPSGEGFFRLSSFGYRDNIIKAVDRIKSSKITSSD